MNIEDVTRWNFGLELWTPARVAAPRLVWGSEAVLRGKLFALRSSVYSPGPFDSLWDVHAVIVDHLTESVQEMVSASPDE